MTQPVCMAAYGGGMNSTAMLVGIVQGKPAPRPGAILFADTGGELPETYAYVALFSEWLQRHGMPAIVTVKDDLGGPLYDRCISQKMMPSVAYGRHRRGCSEKSKQRPQHRYARRVWPESMAAFARDEKVVKLIGFGAEERYRARIDEDRWYEYEYPLIQWGWDRFKCEEEIGQVDLPLPIKSACFFCPFRKKHEILTMEREHPEYLERALVLEANAAPNLQGKSIKGLGGNFSWKEWFESRRRPLPLFPEPEIEPNPFGCVCVGQTPDDEYEDEN